MTVSAAPDSRPIDRFLAALAATGSRVRQSGANQWSASCPNTAGHSHGDKSPSLSFGESPAGKVLVTCHAGCTVPDVAASLGLTLRDLFPTETPARKGVAETKTYNYADADGELSYRIVKRRDADGSKTFKAQHQTSSGQWRDGMGGRAKVLYNLPAVLAAVRDGRRVIVCEGEKDAEAAAWAFADERAAATTNPFGAGKWDASYCDALRGARVVMIGDDDTAGRNHLDVVRLMLSGVAASVEQYLPAAGHNDLSEHLGAGLPLDALRPFQTGAAGETGEDRADGVFVDWRAFWTGETAEREWIAEPLIPAGRAVALYAPAKTGKSLLLLDLAAAVATGRSILGGPNATRRRVLYVDFEMVEDDLRERLTDLGYGPDDDLSDFYYVLSPALGPLDRADGGDALVELARSVDAAVIIIDTLARAVDGDENSADTLRAYFRHCATKLRADGRTVVRVDHAGKDLERGQRGSSAKNDDVDIVWQLTKADGKRLRLRLTHTRLSGLPTLITLERFDDPLRFVNVDGYALPDGTLDAVAVLDRLNVPRDASKRQARELLRAAGVKVGEGRLVAALKVRKIDDGVVDELAAKAVLGSAYHSSRSFTEPSQRTDDDDQSDQREPSTRTGRTDSQSEWFPTSPSKEREPDLNQNQKPTDETARKLFGDDDG